MTDPTPQRIARPLLPLVRVCTAIEVTIGVLCLFIIFVLVLFQAVQRYLPIEQIAWTGEVSRFCLVWLTFSAAGILITTRGHIALEIVDAARSQMFVRVVQSAAMLVVAAIAVTLIVEAVELIQSQRILRSAVLRIPMSWFYVPVLIGVVSTAIRSLVQAIQIALTGPVFSEVEDDLEVTA